MHMYMQHAKGGAVMAPESIMMRVCHEGMLAYNQESGTRRDQNWKNCHAGRNRRVAAL